jgi:hypothetical protein
LAIETSGKSGTVEWDDHQVGELSDGNMEEIDLVPDDNVHQLRVTASRKTLFAFKVHASPGSVPQVESFDAQGLFVITTLGGNAKLYAGKRMKKFRIEEQDVPVTPSGVDFSVGEQNTEIKVGEGSEPVTVAISRSKAPTLTVYSAETGGQVQITSNVQGAKLTVNGTPVNRGRNGWVVRRPPGAYQFELSAEGYGPEKWTMNFQHGQVLPAKRVDLAPVKSAVMASLVIVGGTPDAVVTVDSTSVGRLDRNGNLGLDNTLAEGQHTILLTKLNFEKREILVTVSAKQTEVRLTVPKLLPWPRLAFQTSTPNVEVTYKKVGDSQERQATVSDKLTLQPGSYEIKAEAPGFKFSGSQEPLKLNAGDDKIFPLQFEPIADYEFQDATQVVHDGPWTKSKDAHRIVYLKPGLLHENLIFAKPKKTLKMPFWNKKIEWRVESLDDSARVEYILDGQKIMRKLVVGEATSDQKELKADFAVVTQETSLSVHIEVDGSHVLVTNDKRAVLDDYTAPEHNFSGGRIGIRTESQFVVRKN